MARFGCGVDKWSARLTVRYRFQVLSSARHPGGGGGSLMSNSAEERKGSLYNSAPQCRVATAKNHKTSLKIYTIIWSICVSAGKAGCIGVHV
jgi:hypothetical protein